MSGWLELVLAGAEIFVLVQGDFDWRRMKLGSERAWLKCLKFMVADVSLLTREVSDRGETVASACTGLIS